MAARQVNLQINNALTGELIAEVSAGLDWTVGDVADKAAERRPLPLGLSYVFSLGAQKLAPEAILANRFEAGSSAALQAHVPEIGSIVLPGLTGAAQLPESGDIVIASNGDISGDPQRVAVGHDDGPSSYLWLWRLKRSEGFSTQAAVLLARTRCYEIKELRDNWAECFSLFKAGEGDEKFRYRVFDRSQLQQFGETPDQLPQSQKISPRAWVTVHNEEHVLLGWNRHDLLGSCGIVDRLNVKTGEVVRVARISDLWKAVTDPRDGAVYCSTCYAGWAVSRVQGSSVLHPDCQTTLPTQVLANMGPAIDFDAELCGGALVQPKVDGSVLVALPPDSDTTEAMQLGGEEISDPLDPQYPPGDKSNPWRTLRFPAALPPPTGRGPDGFAADWSSMAFSSAAGRLMALDYGSRTVHTANLGVPDSCESFVAPTVPASAELVTALGFNANVEVKYFVYRRS
mmetsp:Transcript_119429/g.343086  ORF Transcript_119429/g.343086 Transcript_119429/m.343086 type:complete len:457 (-) Transcript_119429:141-1511(-)